MKNLFKFIFCIFLAAVFAFLAVSYTDFAIKKDGYCGNEKFIEFRENEICVSFFGEIYEADIEKIKDIFGKTEIRRLNVYC